MRRRLMITIAALLATAAALAACGGGETAPPATTPAATETGYATTTEPATTAETETETEPAATETDPETEGETGAQATDDGSEGPRADAVIVIENGAPVGGVATVKVKKGDDVRIVVRADAEDELHLHGYEISKAAGPGKPAIFVFPAEFEGIFELESHLGDTLVAKLVVEP